MESDAPSFGRYYCRMCSSKLCNDSLRALTYVYSEVILYNFQCFVKCLCSSFDVETPLLSTAERGV